MKSWFWSKHTKEEERELRTKLLSAATASNDHDRLSKKQRAFERALKDSGKMFAGKRILIVGGTIDSRLDASIAVIERVRTERGSIEVLSACVNPSGHVVRMKNVVEGVPSLLMRAEHTGMTIDNVMESATHCIGEALSSSSSGTDDDDVTRTSVALFNDLVTLRTQVTEPLRRRNMAQSNSALESRTARTQFVKDMSHQKSGHVNNFSKLFARTVRPDDGSSSPLSHTNPYLPSTVSNTVIVTTPSGVPFLPYDIVIVIPRTFPGYVVTTIRDILPYAWRTPFKRSYEAEEVITSVYEAIYVMEFPVSSIALSELDCKVDGASFYVRVPFRDCD